MIDSGIEQVIIFNDKINKIIVKKNVKLTRTEPVFIAPKSTGPKGAKRSEESSQTVTIVTPDEAFKNACKQIICGKLEQWAKYELGCNISIKDRTVVYHDEKDEIKAELTTLCDNLINYFYESKEARKNPYMRRQKNIESFLMPLGSVREAQYALYLLKEKQKQDTTDNKVSFDEIPLVESNYIDSDSE